MKQRHGIMDMFFSDSKISQKICPQFHAVVIIIFNFVFDRIDSLVEIDNE